MILRSRVFRHPADRIEQRIQRVDDLEARMARGIERLLRDRRNRLERSTDRIQMLDPRKPLERGYSWITRDGTPVRRAGDLTSGDRVALQFLDGARTATVNEEEAR
jgi:exodeoxyribonuclease VII large subunit